MSTLRTTAYVLLMLAFAAPLSAQTPMDTAFTYQGQLKNAGAAANGLHDLRFRLYDAEAGGGQVGPTLCLDDLSVTDGLFTTSLDFGADFDGQKRYLEIDVRPDTGLSCANLSGYTTLLPRQELTAAPNATFSQNTRGVNVDASNNVGIGTTTPDSPLRVVGTNAPGTAGIYASAGTGLGDQSKTILGENSSTYGIGLQGRALATSGTNYGVWGESLSPTGIGVIGFHRATSGDGTGVYGASNSPNGWAGYFQGRVAVNGNVGLGTITPGFPLNFLEIPGDKISLYGESGNHYGFGIQSNLLQIHADTNAGDIAFGFGSSANFTERMRVKGNGKVGIGTNNPTDVLTVVGNGTAISTVDSSVVTRLFSASGPGKGYVGTNTPHPFVLRTNQSDRVTIDVAGNVGIGTAIPDEKLSVAGTIESTTGGFRFPDDSIQTTAAQGPPTHFDEFYTPGTQTWTAPVGVTQVVVQVRGAGGSGGGGEGLSTAFGAIFGSGGGGGSGGYCRALVNVSPGATYTVIVGAAGLSVLRATNGMAGGESRFQNAAGAVLRANGGGGGGAGYFNAGGTPAGGAGGGGGAAVANGQVATAGNPGAGGSSGGSPPPGGAGGASVPGVIPQAGMQVSMTLPSGAHVEPSLGTMTQPGGNGGSGGYGSSSTGTGSSSTGGNGYVLISY
jgi:hypothetical protein